LNLAVEKENLMLAEDLASGSFVTPSSDLLSCASEIHEGTYFDQKLKEKRIELEALSLKYGNLPVVKAFSQVIEVLNLLFNTRSTFVVFINHLNDLVDIVQAQQVEIQNKGENDEMAIEILIIIIRFVDILRDIIDWKRITKYNNGDVRNSEADMVFRSAERLISMHEEYVINEIRLSEYLISSEHKKELMVYNQEMEKVLKERVALKNVGYDDFGMLYGGMMKGLEEFPRVEKNNYQPREYEKKLIFYKEEIERLLTVRLAVNNVECVERFDGLVAKWEGMIARLKLISELKNPNYQELKRIYEDHKYKIEKGFYDVKTRADHAKDFEVVVEDFNKRFGDDMSDDIRRSILDWTKEIKGK